MLQSLEGILRALEFRDIVRHINPGKTVQYNGARWLGTPRLTLDKNYVYVGKSSQLPAQLPEEEIGLVVLCDDGRDFSDCRFEVVCVSPQSNMEALCLQMQEQAFCAHEISMISQSIIEKLFRPLSVKEMTDVISEYMDNPVFITFHFGNRSFFYSGDPTVEREAKILRSLRGEQVDYRTMSEVNRILTSREPVIAEDGFCYKGRRRLHVGFSNGLQSDQLIGILTAFEVRHSFRPLDSTFLSFMSYILSMKASEPAFQREMISQEYTQYLHELIRGGQPGADADWENTLFGTQRRNYLAALTDTRQLSSVALEDLKYRLYRIAGFSVILMRGSYLVVIANLRERTAQTFLRQMDEICQMHQLVFGVSEFFSDIRLLRKYYVQAKRVREISEAVGVTCGTLPFETYKTALLVRDISAAENPELFVDASIDRLIAHDAQENTEYVHTLETYIRCGMSKERTRAELNIHRNTLTYRLGRIEEILGHRLDDSHYLVGLFFAFTIRKIAGKRSFSEE